MKKTLLILLGFFLLIQTGYSQQQNGPWTLEQCIDYALQNNIRVKRSQLDFEQSRADLLQSRAAMIPTLNASGTHRYAFGRTIDPVENRFVEQTIQSNDFGLNSDVLIFGGLQTQNTIKQNKAISESNIAAMEQAKNDVSINVASSFLTVLLNQELLENAIFQFNTSTEQVGRTQRLMEAGSVPRANLLEIKATNATDELAVVNAENQLALSKLQLMQFLQLPYNPEFEVADPQIDIDENVGLIQSVGEIYDAALITQPIMRSMNLRLKSAHLSETIARGGNSPSLVAFGNVNTYYTNRLANQFSFGQQLDNHLGQNLGFRINIPIFNNYRVKNDIQRSRIFIKNAEINSLETQNNLRQEVEQAYLDARTASKRYNSVQKQVEALREAFRVTEQRFNLGAANAVDYNVSKNNLNQAESDMIRAKFDYIFRMKVLDFYQGKALSLD
ncbi:MAG: TolC family protein [Bacteroidota bacterium]|nr:TolC family protein [Bacteroidota bacterium]